MERKGERMIIRLNGTACVPQGQIFFSFFLGAKEEGKGGKGVGKAMALSFLPARGDFRHAGVWLVSV